MLQAATKWHTFSLWVMPVRGRAEKAGWGTFANFNFISSLSFPFTPRVSYSHSDSYSIHHSLVLLYSVLLCIIMYYVLCIIMYYFIMYYCLMYLFCWCLSEFHPSIDLSFAFLLPTTTFHVAGVGWSVQVHSLSGGLSKTSSAA